MEEELDLPVAYKGKTTIYKLRLLVQGYQHKMQVMVNEMPVLFEPDEERNYRALIDTDTAAAHKIDAALLQAIAETIEEIVKD